MKQQIVNPFDNWKHYKRIVRKVHKTDTYKGCSTKTWNGEITIAGQVVKVHTFEADHTQPHTLWYVNG